ncbi:hypothetical protein [Alteromonas sp. M12]|uniref:hypothetical protein n=1 Tax=Alteromonas sp. M12 TaxID=3135644 RepID=UPI00319DB61C
MKVNCESCHKNILIEKISGRNCGPHLCQSCLNKHQVNCEIKQFDFNITELFDAQVDARFTKAIEQLPSVAKFTSKISAEVYKGFVFLQPDWRVYEFHISLAHFKESYSLKSNKKESIDAFINFEIANINMLSPPFVSDLKCTRPFFSLPGLSWQPITNIESTKLINTFRHFLGEKKSEDEIRFLSAPLSFYPKARLIAFHSSLFENPHKWLYFLEANLENGNTYYYTLNGLSAPIHDCNGVHSIHLTQDNVLEYLCFFCFFIQSEGHSFYIIASKNAPSLPDFMWAKNYIHDNKQLALLSKFKPLKIIESKADAFTCEATMYHGNNLSIIEAEVSANGNVFLKNSSVISEALPFKLEISLS